MYVIETQKRLTNIPGLGTHPHFEQSVCESSVIYTVLVELIRSRCRSQEPGQKSLSTNYRHNVQDAYQCIVNRVLVYLAHREGHLTDLDLDKVTHMTHTYSKYDLSEYPQAQFRLIDVFWRQDGEVYESTLLSFEGPSSTGAKW